MRRGNFLFYAVMGILAAGLAILFFNHGAGTSFGLANDEFARLVMLVALVGAGVVRRGNLGEAARNALIWLVIILALATLYLYRYDLQAVGTRLSAGLMPGSAVTRQTAEGETEVIVRKGLGGHFQIEAEIDGTPVDFLVDTGATTIALTYRDAERLGLDPQTLAFSRTVMTANGPARAAPVRLRQITIGPIVRHDVRATVSAEGALGQSLLGMNFLGDLSSFSMQRDELVLTD
ncbi:retropepsin-like aspartic protease family protein [Pararhizobium haloflavum]|uniref:retropepsin-like aspartic protease family protein n=1 Tax=Pararhizobium haloflavum TaxID=2037914 RepID=UPI000C18CB8C|nr:TIGR02281 family clan AA aspartic protease [Pararhizobium haloflavum]